MPNGAKFACVVLAAGILQLPCIAVAAKSPERAAKVRTCDFSISGRNDPDTMISGKLERRMVWGPPNYGEEPKTDKRYSAWFVVLDGPVRVMTGPDIGEQPQVTIAHEIQIRWGSSGEEGYSKFRNRHVVVRGKLFTQVFPGDHTPVVIEASALGAGDAIRCPAVGK